MASRDTTQSSVYGSLGLVDAAIAEVARKHHCTVLTHDLDLYLTLTSPGSPAFNFTHLQAQAWHV